jgi:hypothetical protein
VRTAEDLEQCDALERYRLRHFALDSPERRALSEWAASHPRPPREPTTYPIDDGYSWRAGVAVALSDDSGTDAADDWCVGAVATLSTQ